MAQQSSVKQIGNNLKITQSVPLILAFEFETLEMR